MDREKLHRLLRLGIEKGASDIHFQVGYLPLYRFNGDLVELRYKVLGASDTEAMARILLEADPRQGVLEWIPNWKARGWNTADKKPVKNQDLWQTLDALVVKHDLDWHWVKGHSGNVGNERVDALANRAIDAFLSG